jgi:predicted HD phosphohydrolase
MKFTNIAHADADDWVRITKESAPFVAALPDRILAHLKLLEGDYGGFPVDRLTHCLQTATLAHKAGKDEEYVVCALLHDVGDTLASYNHADMAATLLQPFVSEANHWMVEKHAIFQGYYFFQHLGLDRHLRDEFRSHPCYQQTVEFCALYDAPAFNPDTETFPLAFFEPMVRKVFAKPKRSLYLRPDGEMSY